VWRETGIIDKFSEPELKLRWRVPVSGGYSDPTVADHGFLIKVVDPMA